MTTAPRDMLIAKMFAQPKQQPIIPQTSQDGQPIQGPGTGTSDSVPATVVDQNNPSDVQPAQLSKDEFVVKADYVRKLGQGNPELGAKILQGLLDNLMAHSEPKVKENQTTKGIGSLLGASKQ